MAPHEHAVRAWLLGADGNVGPDNLDDAGLPAGTSGVLRRLLQGLPGDPCGHAQITTLSAARGFTQIPDFALSALITVEVQPVRIRLDGQAATASIGLLLPVGTVLTLSGRKSIQAASMIETAASATIDVAYFT